MASLHSPGGNCISKKGAAASLLGGCCAYPRYPRLMHICKKQPPLYVEADAASEKIAASSLLLGCCCCKVSAYLNNPRVPQIRKKQPPLSWEAAAAMEKKEETHPL